MKKLFMTMLTVLAFKAAYALPVGNPSEASLLYDGLIWEGHCGDPCDPCLSWADAFSVRVGFYGDYVFNRHMEVENNIDRDIEDTEIFTNAGIITANLYDRFDVFATLGATNIFIDTNLVAFLPTISGPRIEIETDSNFSWSVGTRATLWECGCTTLGAEAQYFSTNPEVSRVTTASVTSEYPDNVHLSYREWQVGVGISHRINTLVPYLAAKWSRARMDFDNPIFTDLEGVVLSNLRSKKGWSYAVGVSLVDCEKASLTVEGRWAGEKAVYASGQIRF